ncbi:hypothetical protein [Sphingomonas sp.]|uniref:hypothetical protein n=1 Tax=Sphingomonas sp. TaxID=28214 RepID=UPI003CC678E7
MSEVVGLAAARLARLLDQSRGDGPPEVAVIGTGAAAQATAAALRRRGVITLTFYRGGRKAMLQRSHKAVAGYALFVGDGELALRDLFTGRQAPLPAQGWLDLLLDQLAFDYAPIGTDRFVFEAAR